MKPCFFPWDHCYHYEHLFRRIKGSPKCTRPVLKKIEVGFCCICGKEKIRDGW
jgi:hypothetical protein